MNDSNNINRLNVVSERESHFLIYFVLPLLLISCSTKKNEKDWREDLRKKYSHNHRITFGESSITRDHGDAVSSARSTALAEMAKTFFVKVSSSSASSTNYEKNSERQSVSEKFFSQVLEESRQVELSGIDLSAVDIDHERGIVTVAAVLDLSKFRQNLASRIQQIIDGINQKRTLKSCKNRNDLKRIRDVLKNLSEATERESLLASFTQEDPKVQLIRDEYLGYAQDCREKFIFTSDSQKLLANGSAKSFLEKQGFSFRPSYKSLGGIKIEISEKIWPPEIKFDRINLLGRIEITISHSGEQFQWAGQTIRQIDSSKELALMKLNVRLMDEVQRGVQTLVEEYF